MKKKKKILGLRSLCFKTFKSVLVFAFGVLQIVSGLTLFILSISKVNELTKI